MSLQTDALISLFELLDSDKQEEFVDKLLSRLSPHKLEQVCENAPARLRVKYHDHLDQLLKNLGSSDELIKVLSFSIYNASHAQAFSFHLKVASPPFLVVYNIEINPKSYEIKVITSGRSTLNQLIVDNKRVIYDSLCSFCKKSEN